MNTPSAPDSDTCAVCGKGIANGGGYMRLFVNGRPVELCCPMCLKVYHERLAQAEADKRRGDERERTLGWDEKW